MKRSALLTLLLGIAFAMQGAPKSAADVGYGLVASPPVGEAEDFRDLAVDGASGNVFLATTDGVRVLAPEALGTTPLLTFGEAELHQVGGIAVDQVDGSVYVSDKTVDETQTVRIVNSVSGSFELEFEGEPTAPIVLPAQGELEPAEIESALEGLAAVGPGEVRVPRVSGRAFEVSFVGGLGGVDLPQMTADSSGLEPVGQTTPTVEILNRLQGAPGGLLKFVPDDRLDPTSYSEDPFFAAPATGTLPQEVGSFGALATDPGSGDPLLADAAKRRVVRLSPAGAFIGAFDGSASPQGPFDSVLGLSADPSGAIYVIRDGTLDGDGGGGVTGAKVERFAADGSGGEIVGAGELDTAYSVAFDPGTGNLLVTTGVTTSPEAPETLRLAVYHEGIRVERSPVPGAELTRIGEVAADPGSSGRVYVLANDPSLTSLNLFVLGRFGIPAVQPPTEMHGLGDGFVGARLSGSVDPMGRSTEYAFEYSSDGGSTWSATPQESAGSGEVPVPVAANVTGLAPGASYLVRLTTFGFGVSKTAVPLPFSSLSLLPDPTTGRAERIGTGSATLLGQVRLSDQDASYFFEYGLGTSYGSRSAKGALVHGVGQRAVEQEIEGLEPGSLYHYRLVVKSEAGVADGADSTFTTQPVAPVTPTQQPVPSQPPSLVSSSRLLAAALTPPSPQAATRRCPKGLKPHEVRGKVRCSRPGKKRKHRARG